MIRFQICDYNPALRKEIFNFNVSIKRYYVPLLVSKIYIVFSSL
jgi:hypothetical protein